MQYVLVLITISFLFLELQDSIETQYEDVYIQRQQDEMASGIFNEPLPPVRRTLTESFNIRQGLCLLLLLIVSPMILIQFGIIFIFTMPMALLLVPIQIGIVLMLNLISYLIHDQTEESPLVAFYQSLLSLGFLPGDYIPYIGYLLYNLE